MRIWSNQMCVALLGLVSLVASAAGQSSLSDAAAVPAPVLSESQQHARDVLMQMARYVSGLQEFSVTIHAGYDVVQEDGQKIQFLEDRDLSIDRPNHLRMTESHDSGGSDDIVFDGSKITIWQGTSKVFAQATQPAGIDDGLIYFLRDLRMKLPLAPLFMSTLPAELDRRIESIDYVEDTSATGVHTDQLAARMNTGVDVQLWIAVGKQPLPQRIVLTYRDAPGAPQFWAEFTNWNLQPAFDTSAFEFSAPADARQIPFAVQFPLYVQETQHPEAARPKGDQP